MIDQLIKIGLINKKFVRLSLSMPFNSYGLRPPFDIVMVSLPNHQDDNA
jgi:hypothetical protein